MRTAVQSAIPEPANTRYILSFSSKGVFDSDDAAATALIRGELKQTGMPIGAYDLLMAGQALNNDCTLVTDNVREFSRVTNLKWTDWKQTGA